MFKPEWKELVFSTVAGTTNKNVTQPFKNDNERATTTFFPRQPASDASQEKQGLASWKSRPLPAVISSAAGVRHLSRLSLLTLGRLPRWQPHYSDNSSRLETFLRPLWCAAPQSWLRNVNSWAAGCQTHLVHVLSYGLNGQPLPQRRRTAALAREPPAAYRSVADVWSEPPSSSSVSHTSATNRSLRENILNRN